MLEGFSHNRPNQAATPVVNTDPLPLSMLILRCGGIVLEAPYTHHQRPVVSAPIDVFVAPDAADAGAPLRYRACVVVSRVEVQQHGAHCFRMLDDDAATDYILTRVNVRAFVDAYVLAHDHPMATRATRTSARMSAQHAPTDAFPHGLPDEMAAVAPVWAHPADAGMLSARRLGGRSGRRLVASLSASRAPVESNGAMLPLPLVPLLKAGPLRLLHTHKRSRLPTPPGTTSEVLSVSVMAAQAWLSLWQGGHLLSLALSMTDAMRRVEAQLHQAIEVGAARSEACVEAAHLLAAYKRMAVTVEMPLLQIMALVGMHLFILYCTFLPQAVSDEADYDQAPVDPTTLPTSSQSVSMASAAAAAAASRAAKAHHGGATQAWTRCTTPVLTATLVGLRGALTLVGSQPHAASCSLDGVMLRDLGVDDPADPHAYLARPLPTNAMRMACMATYGRRMLLGVQVATPARYRWLRALQYAFLVTRSNLLDAGRRGDASGLDSGYSPNRSFFGSTVIGPMVRLAFSVGSYRRDPAQLRVTVCLQEFVAGVAAMLCRQLGQLLLAMHVRKQGSLLRLLQDSLWMLGFVNDTGLLNGALSP